jgi:ferrous iron transport protein A
MRDNLIRMCRAGDPRCAFAMSPPATLSLHQLAAGARGTVARVVSASPEIDAVALRRLGELGFLPGEPVQLLRRGPGGREPLAVVIGETMFALRLLEAQCIEVTLEGVSAATPAGGRAATAAAEQSPVPATAERVLAPARRRAAPSLAPPPRGAATEESVAAP